MNSASEELKKEVEAAIRRELNRLKQDYGVHSAAKIVDELSSAVFSGGKRMRPVLCCWGFEAAGGQLSGSIITAAASLELLHTFAILHDDIMDAPVSRRRGSPVHERVARERTDLAGSPAAGRFGVSVAILTGDLALVASDRMFLESGFSPEELAPAWEEISRMRLDAVAGQFLDLSLSGQELQPEAASAIARLKSGSYSVRGPLVVGASLAGAGPAARDALASFGENLGEAFQLADDLAGMFGDPEVTGKDTESDLVQGKPTFLIALALEHSTGKSRELIREAWGNRHATPEAKQAARNMIGASGARGKTAARIRVLVTQANAAIDDPASKDLDPGACSNLQGLAESILSGVEALT